jgi:hypothetical protein
MADKMDRESGAYWKMMVRYRGNLEDRDSWDDLGVEWEDNTKIDLQ